MQPQFGRGPRRHLRCINTDGHDGGSGCLKLSQVLLQLTALLTTPPSKISHIENQDHRLTS
jgi:hypothetical protein